MPPATADVELTDVRAASTSGGVVAGEEEDDVPLLLNAQPSHTCDASARAGGAHMHPRANASYTRDGRSWASKLVFSWVRPVLGKIRDGDELHLDDALLLPPELSAEVLSGRFQLAWEASVDRGQPSIASAFRAVFFGEFFMAGVFRLVSELAVVAAPMVMREIILFVQGEATVVPNNLAGGLSLAVFLLVLVLLKASTLQHFIYGVFVVGAGVNTAVTVAVYDKALRLSRMSLEGPRLGQALNFQAKDANKLRQFVVFAHNLWAAPVTAIGCTVLLFRVLGLSALVGVSIVPVLIPLETWVAKRSATYRKSVLKVSDARISLIGEIVDGIKTVKLNSLDAGFRSRVEALRAKELNTIRRAATLNAYNQAVMRSSPIVVALATFATYVLSGHELDAQTAFTALSLFGIIGHPFHALPKAVQLLADAKVSLQRLEQFLLETETTRLDAMAVTNGRGGRNGDEGVDSSPRVVMEDAAFGPVAGQPCLQHVTAEMLGGLSVVVGPVGCGKSSFLRGLVEHLPPGGGGGDVDHSGGGGNGQVKVVTPDNRVAYCPDTAWIVNASARDNICLGSPAEAFDAALYHKCVEACALEQDFGEWAEGDRAIIGAKGITVSGGQKARIALARAMYARCGVVLLDDPLSALDNIVGGWVFRRAVLEMAADAAVIMTTHQYQYMRTAHCQVFSAGQGTLALRANEGVGGSFLGAAGGAANDADGEDGPAPPSGDLNKTLSTTANVSAQQQQESEGAEDSTDMSRLSTKVDSDRDEGGASWDAFVGYLKACGVLVVSAALGMSVLAQLVDVSKEVVLAFWSDSAGESGPTLYLAWYSLVCLWVVGLNVARFFVVCWLGLRGSESLHKSLLLKVMGAPLPFFQVTAGGRITSRFSSDFDSIDFVIPGTLSTLVDAGLQVLASVGVVVGTSPAVVLLIFPIAMAYYRIQKTYRMSAKELKRLDSATKSPIYSHFQETLDGLSSIQAYAIEQNMRRNNFFMVDANARARLTWDATNRWLGIRLDFLGALVVFFAAMVAVVAGRTSPGIVGLGLSYALAITRTLSFGVRASTALENEFNSVERVQEFIGLDQEEEEDGQTGGRGPATRSPWPSSGLEMRDVYARHRPDLPPVLSGVSLSVRCGERVGICGRSGSGKSSLAMALVRVVECFQGSVLVDGEDIRDFSLALLRSGVTVISQDAHLFSGNVREAIDPLGQCSDARIWEIIKMVGLKDAVADLPLGLVTSVSERGGNWSAGQRQLFCIARAMVNQPGVLVFDEATANVDAHTDGVIRQLIQSHLNQAAVIVIAHRLEDVISCHRVVVMSAGVVAEEGEPSRLLDDPDSMLSLLAQELGPELERKLREQHTHSAM